MTHVQEKKKGGTLSRVLTGNLFKYLMTEDKIHLGNSLCGELQSVLHWIKTASGKFSLTKSVTCAVQQWSEDSRGRTVSSDLLQDQKQTRTIQKCRDVMKGQKEELEKDVRQLGAPERQSRKGEVNSPEGQGTIPDNTYWHTDVTCLLKY